MIIRAQLLFTITYTGSKLACGYIGNFMHSDACIAMNTLMSLCSSEIPVVGEVDVNYCTVLWCAQKNYHQNSDE